MLVTTQEDSQYILRGTGHTTTTSSVLAPRAVSASATAAGALVLAAIFLACSFPSATSLLGLDAGAAAAALLAGTAFLGAVSGLAAFAAEFSDLATAALAEFMALLPFTLVFRTSGTAVLVVPEDREPVAHVAEYEIADEVVRIVWNEWDGQTNSFGFWPNGLGRFGR